MWSTFSAHWNLCAFPISSMTKTSNFKNFHEIKYMMENSKNPNRIRCLELSKKAKVESKSGAKEVIQEILHFFVWEFRKDFNILEHYRGFKTGTKPNGWFVVPVSCLRRRTPKVHLTDKIQRINWGNHFSSLRSIKRITRSSSSKENKFQTILCKWPTTVKSALNKLPPWIRCQETCQGTFF